MSSRTRGTHFSGPLLGRDDSLNGLFDDVSLGTVDGTRSPYQIQVEDFGYPFADGELAGSGWALQNIGTAASPSEVVDAATGFLLLNPGTGNDDGTQIAYNAAPTGATTAVPELNLLGSITSTPTLMDKREMVMYFRVGFNSEKGSGDPSAWQGKACFGWITTDAALMTPGTGALDIVAGGGTGFHVAEDGTLGVFSTNAAVTSSTATSTNIKTDLSAVSAGTFVWYTLGFRTRWIDASAGTGKTDFYINGNKSTTITGTMPMDSTEVYAITFEYLNGPAGFEMDMAVDYVISGLTRPGLTYPYDTGAY